MPSPIDVGILTVLFLSGVWGFGTTLLNVQRQKSLRELHQNLVECICRTYIY